MTHDALCDGDDYEGPFCSVRCSCDLISKVREDERAAALDAAEAAVEASWSWPDWADDGKGEQEVMLVGDAISAIRALKEKP